jgi:3'-5' exonuclease
MTPILCFDLETVPDAAGLRALGHFPAELSDSDGVSHARQARLDAGQSDFFPHHLQRIWVIGCAFRDDEGFRIRCLGATPGVSDEEEAQRLRQFFNTIERHQPQLVSWNGSGFDAPVLHQRAMMRCVPGGVYWDQGEHNRDFKYNNYLARYHSRHLDLMDVLAAYSGRANAPLDAMAQLCGFPGKLGEDGAKVWDAYLEGRWAEVAAYCETDVVNTYLLFTRFRLLRGELHQAAYLQELELVRSALQAQIGQPDVPLSGQHWERFLAAWPHEKE